MQTGMSLTEVSQCTGVPRSIPLPLICRERIIFITMRTITTGVSASLSFFYTGCHGHRDGESKGGPQASNVATSIAILLQIRGVATSG